MTEAEFKSLNIGDIIRHEGTGEWQALVVTERYGDHVTAVRTANVTNPAEWRLVAKSAHKATQ